MKVTKILVLCLLALFITMSTVHAQVSFIVTSPKAGDSWKLGETKNIEWSYSSPQAVSQNWKLELMKGSTVLGTIANNASGSSYSWVVGQYIGGNATPGADYKIRVSHVSAPGVSNNSGVFSIISSSIAQKITAPKQPPMHRTSDPKQKLRELQAAEDRKRVSRQQAIKAEITKLVQKDIEIQKTKKKVEICTSPKIKSVSYPHEVYPGDSVYIRGCGFGISKGMVTISPLNKQLEIETWVDGGIAGKIPQDITGFADPKTITLKVVTYQGQASAPSESLILKPIFMVFNLYMPNPEIGAASLGRVDGGDTVHVMHSWAHTLPCEGFDRLFHGLQLHNNWVYHSFNLSAVCYKNTEKVNCSVIGSGANPGQNMDLLLGRSTIPPIQIKWLVGPVTRPDEYNYLYYDFQIFIFGPAGTNYQ